MGKLTLDEAIKHCLEVAEEQELSADDKEMYSEMFGEDYKGFEEGCLECAADHRQLAEWLKELKEWRANPFYQIKTECKNNYYCNKCAFLDHCPFSNGNRVAAEYPMDWVVY
jgi:hypothetical protein